MRYIGIDTYAFTDTTGRTLTVKEIREVPAYQVGFSMNKPGDVDLDELASRTYVYGDGGERDTYKLFEANMAAILDARFDMSRVLKLAIPI
jgi:hypothetical protein